MLNRSNITKDKNQNHIVSSLTWCTSLTYFPCQYLWVLTTTFREVDPWFSHQILAVTLRVLHDMPPIRPVVFCSVPSYRLSHFAVQLFCYDEPICSSLNSCNRVLASLWSMSEDCSFSRLGHGALSCISKAYPVVFVPLVGTLSSKLWSLCFLRNQSRLRHQTLGLLVSMFVSALGCLGSTALCDGA